MMLTEKIADLIDEFAEVRQQLSDLTENGDLALSFNAFGKIQIRGQALVDPILAKHMPAGQLYHRTVDKIHSPTSSKEDYYITGSVEEIKQKINIMLAARVKLLNHLANNAQNEASNLLGDAEKFRDEARALKLHVDPHPLEALAMEGVDEPSTG